MSKEINIFSNFNISNICSILKDKIDFKINDYSYSEIFQQIETNKKLDVFNIFFINVDNYEVADIKAISLKVLKKNLDCLIIPISIIDSSSSFKIINKDQKSELNKIRILENFFYKERKKNKINVLNFFSVASKFEVKVFNYKNWFLYKNPFSKDFEQYLSNYFYNYIQIHNHKRKKAVFIDLDDTLWGGEIAELGFKNIKIGNEDPLSEAHYVLQKTLKNLKDTGIILGIISKNKEKIALEAFKNKKMYLKKNDFAGFKINFKKKSENIVDLCKELNISTDSVVFLDNSYYERNEVRSKLPEVLVPELHDEPYNYFNDLLSSSLVNFIKLSKEDVLRYQSYQKPKNENAKKISHIEWLKSLNMKCTIEKINIENLERCAQMQERINQINLKSKRLSINNLKKNLVKKNLDTYVFSLKDKYADLGIVGFATIKKQNETITLDDFLMSCRSFGRNLEQNIFNFFAKKYIKDKIKKINVELIKSKKNMLCQEILDKNLTKVGKDRYIIFKKNIKKIPITNYNKT